MGKYREKNKNKKNPFTLTTVSTQQDATKSAKLNKKYGVIYVTFF
jgi:hypothetical protein